MGVRKRRIYSVRVLNDVRHGRNAVSVIQYGSAVSAVHRLLRALVPSVARNCVIQVRYVIVCLLIRPHSKADGIGSVVFQHAQRRQIPVQIAVCVEGRDGHDVGFAA